ncbi:DUF4268 domain-containing protein [Psychromarinibacter sp. S121]|uniref:DUF4268 domain-containing protein n=1 Tax=Psychromarinibacter sp. S121 TaxID=3415127 RepID=UPI003C79D9CD
MKQDIRLVWPYEPSDFTPWLSQPENLELLADTLGLGQLHKVDTEVPVGSFRADIICVDSMDNTVLIENQYGASDHKHLGQTLTYLAGKGAKCIIWIAERIKEEHRAVIDWLNEATSLEYAFFGVEIEVWRIGDSLPAPKFEIVSQPNTWERQQKQTARQPEEEDSHRRIEYWASFLRQLPAIEGLTQPPKAPNHGWVKLPFASGLKIPSSGGVYAYRLVAENRLGVYLSIGRHDPDVFSDWLKSIEAKSYPSLQAGKWSRATNGIYGCYQTTDGDPLDDGDWERQHQWMIGQCQSFARDWRHGLRDDALRLWPEEV